MARFSTYRVVNIIRQTHDSVTIQVTRPLFRHNYLPGQTITAKIYRHGSVHYRSYSISSTAGIDKYLSFTVKKVPGGVVSSYFNDALSVGDRVELFIAEPSSFCLRHSKQHYNTMLLFGAGSGVTPLFSILKYTLRNFPHCEITLVLGNREESDIIFRDELLALQQQHPKTLHCYFTLTQPDQHWSGRTGRIDAPLINAIISSFLNRDSKPDITFVCGPEGLMDTVENTMCGALGPNLHILRESYTRSNVNTKTTHTFPDTSITIVDGDASIQIPVESGESILAAAIKHNIDLKHSCKSGFCSACRCKIRKGKVSLEGYSCLTEKERNEGSTLLCIGYPDSHDVVIETQGP
ncbi:phenylacetate-CoA oxygenase/reductase subunit PaaK [Aurantivibrio plasticivorans]